MNVLSTSKMAIGESVTLEITDVKEGKFGAVYVATINGQDTEVRPSGNLKFLADDLANGKKSLNTAYTITRVADKSGIAKSTGKAYTSSQFEIAAASAQATNKDNPVAAKLAAIRAKRTQN